MPVDVTEPPEHSPEFEVFAALGRFLRERIPELGIPGAVIVFDGSPAEERSEQADGDRTDATGADGR